MSVRVYGDTAVVSYRSTDKGMYKDTDISGQSRWTDVFVKQKGAVADRGDAGHADRADETRCATDGTDGTRSADGTAEAPPPPPPPPTP